MGAYGAYGLVEVRGSANGIRCADIMCKAAKVDIVARYTRNGGHDTVVVGGEVSAVTAAVDSVRTNPPCEVYAAAVMSGPSAESDKVFSDWHNGIM